MIRAVVFDCFGVLVTEGWYAFRDTYFPVGAEDGRRAEALDLHRAANYGAIDYATFEREIAKLANIDVEEIRANLDNNQPNAPLFAYITERLKPRYKIGMLSNAADDWLEELFTSDQRALFDAVVLSYEIRAAKPDARAYQVIAERLGIAPEECVFVDDSERFCAGAREQGMQAVWYQDFASCKAELERILADSKN
ncbi:MAG TPA: HAD family phosphatase [Candidatus Saccharimonadales bacterium]|nr:HAD family phosphatase [Candidatus Saccharimonadales bacterium]